MEQQPTDATLVERAKDGDSEAFAILVDRYQTPLFRLVLRMVRDRAEAEDIVQDALITAWRKLDRIRESDRLRPWLYQIASNRALDVLRSRTRHPADSLDAGDGLAEQLPAAAAGDPETQVLARAQWQQLAMAVGSLPPQQRAVWILREFDGFSYSEIAKILHVSEGTVRGQLARARTRLVRDMRTWT